MESLIKLDGQKVVMILPHGNGHCVVDLDEVYRVESRQHEVATVNVHRAPELMTVLNRGFVAAKEAAIKVQGLIDEARKAERTRKAIVILDEVPKILVAKGLATTRSPGGSEDLRSAVLAQDQEYVLCLDHLAYLQAAKELLELKAKGFENSYTSVKKIFGGDSWQYQRNPNLSHAPLPPGLQAGDTVTPAQPPSRPTYTPEDPRSRFGKSQ